MEAFDYLAPRSLTEAYSALGSGRRSLMLAGGTDVIVQLREDRRHCDQLIDVKHIPELMSVTRAADGELEIGAAVPLAQLYEDLDIARRFPAMVDAAHIIGGIQIQSRASLGGNLCNASPAADSSPALMALGATLVIGSASGTREVAAEDFFLGPGRNALQPNELLLQVKLPAPAPNASSFYHRFIPRNEMDIAECGAGVSVVLNDARDTFVSARVALGAVAPTPLYVSEAGTALAGKAVSEGAINEAAEIARAASRPIDDMRGTVEHRKQLAYVLTKRALTDAVDRARS